MDIQPLINMINPMLKGSLYTVQLFFVTLLISLPLGLCVTFLYTGRWIIIRKITGFYVLIMRGTPLLLQMFFVYFGLPFIPVIGPYLKFDAFTSAAIAFILNYAAYFAEIFRGGLLAIDRGQHEAAKVLGLTHFQTTYKIVLPQMFRVTLPSVSNEALILVKDTALITVLALHDLLSVSRTIVNATASFVPFIVAGVFYLIMSYIVTVFFHALERKFSYE